MPVSWQMTMKAVGHIPGWGRVMLVRAFAQLVFSCSRATSSFCHTSRYLRGWALTEEGHSRAHSTSLVSSSRVTGRFSL